jgi:hypothetical protein
MVSTCDFCTLSVDPYIYIQEWDYNLHREVVQLVRRYADFRGYGGKS